ncbi:MAG: hypothetical protein JWR85_2195 [Marmoricola sp.]|nr:hypothetical protein [Marmoricola sp.]
MTAAAGAAKGVQTLSDRPGFIGAAAMALILVVAAGLVEGSALGIAQGSLLGNRWPALDRHLYLGATVVAAGLGWAAGSAPGILSGDDGGPQPPLLMMLAGAAGIGLVMGPLLGVAQALVLRHAVSHPWRWVAANAVAWPPAMVVIFFGASRPASDWSVLAVVTLGSVTGLVAGSCLGWLTGLWLPSLDGQPVHNRLVLALVKSQRFGMDRRLVGLAIRGRRSGVVRRFPTQYVTDVTGLVVVPGRPGRKLWWRNLPGSGAPIAVLFEGHWEAATARVLLPGDDGHAEALATYLRRWPKVAIAPDQPVVSVNRIVRDQHHSRTPRGLSARSRSTTGSRVP